MALCWRRLAPACSMVEAVEEQDEVGQTDEAETVENACIYTLPDQLPPIFVAASGPRAAEAAGRMRDGLITTAPEAETPETVCRRRGNW